MKEQTKMNRDQITQNLIDRGRVLDIFMTERLKIIDATGKIHRARRTETRMLENIELNLMEQQLFQALDILTQKTEEKLTEIRNRRRAFLENQQQQ